MTTTTAPVCAPLKVAKPHEWLIFWRKDALDYFSLTASSAYVWAWDREQQGYAFVRCDRLNDDKHVLVPLDTEYEAKDAVRLAELKANHGRISVAARSERRGHYIGADSVRRQA